MSRASFSHSQASSEYASAVEDVDVEEELGGAVFACAQRGDARTLRVRVCPCV